MASRKSNPILTIYRRELKSLFASPVAYVFLIAFLVLTGVMTYMVGNAYERRQADLAVLFMWMPIIFLLLAPAASMGLWAEERRTGTIELLLTSPITLGQAVTGKFLASWTFMTIGVLLTFPAVLTACYLGDPDLGVIASGYLGLVLMAGAYIAVGMFASALTRSQVIAFVTSLGLCLLLFMAGFQPITGMFAKWAPHLAEAVASFSTMTHFYPLQRGVVDLAAVAYYLSVMVFASFAALVALDNRKAS